MPIIRRDADQAFSLVITAAGFAALGIEPQAEADAGAASDKLVDDGNGAQMGDGAVAPRTLMGLALRRPQPARDPQLRAKAPSSPR
jgi:hypothetical protein